MNVLPMDNPVNYPQDHYEPPPNRYNDDRSGHDAHKPDKTK